MSHYYIGIDVGTGSVRGLIVDEAGTIKASASKPITTWRDSSDHRIFEQSTEDIWGAIKDVVRRSLAEADLPAASIRGIGFDATCSLAVTDHDGRPATVTRGSECGSISGTRNVILWADHRAEDEANHINTTPQAAEVLDFVGGTVSLEMEIPKVLWLQRNMPAKRFNDLQFFDLPDYLTYRATGSIARSTCSLTCKCSYIPNQGWKRDFFSAIGLQSVVDSEFAQIGATPPLTAGLPVGTGLTAEAATDLGLTPGTPVASSVIDAYAGWLGTIAARFHDSDNLAGTTNTSTSPTIETSAERLAVVAGTSSCHLINSPHDIFVKGVWGPYKNAVLPGYWMNEGGQSSTGQLIDFVLTTHPAYNDLQARATAESTDIYALLFAQLDVLCAEQGLAHGQYTHLVRHLHMYPDLHGNRSPLADPQMRGSLVGLELASGLGDLAKKFYVALEAIALQTRHIVEAMREKGHTIKAICISGGQAKNKHLCALIAALCDVEVIVPSTWASVVLGAAMLGRLASEVVIAEGSSTEGYLTQTKLDEVSSKYAGRLWDIMVEMTPHGSVIRSTATSVEKRILDVKYSIFKEQIDIQRRWRKEIDAAASAT